MWSDWFSLNYKVVCSNSDLKKNRRCTCLDSIFSPAAQHEPTAPSIISDRSGRFAFAPPTFCGTGDRSIISVRWVWRIYCSNQIEKINNCIYRCMIAVLWCLYNLWYPFASVNDPFLFLQVESSVCWLAEFSVIRSTDPSFHWLNFLNAKSKCIDHLVGKMHLFSVWIFI